MARHSKGKLREMWVGSVTKVGGQPLRWQLRQPAGCGGRALQQGGSGAARLRPCWRPHAPACLTSSCLQACVHKSPVPVAVVPQWQRSKSV